MSDSEGIALVPGDIVEKTPRTKKRQRANRGAADVAAPGATYSTLRSAAMCVMCAVTVVLLAALVGVVAGWVTSEKAEVEHLTEVEQNEADMLNKVHSELLAERKNEAELLREFTELKREVRGGSSGGSEELPGVGGGADDTTPLLQFDTAALKTKTVEMRTMLTTYWSGTEVLDASLLLQPTDPRYQKGLDFIAEKMARAMVWGGKFVVAAMGSSVTAGHDNCNYDSYERQLERLWAPLWKLAGVTLSVRNAGEGGGCGDSFRNQLYCVRNTLGDDADIVQYSWTYFEGDPGEAAAAHESFVRFALAMKRSPAPLFMNTGGYNSACQSKFDNSGAIFDKYAEWGINAICLQTGIKKKGYAGKKWGAVGDGIHQTTRYGEEAVPKPLPAGASASVIAARKKSLGVVFRNWHPGPLGFQVVSDTMFYYYSAAMLRALEAIEAIEGKYGADKVALRAALAARWPKDPTRVLASSLPEPVHCSPKVCAVEDPPSCMNVEQPTYGKHQIFLMSMNASMNPYKEHADATKEGWKMNVKDAGKGNLVPAEEQALEGCAHLDHCAGWAGNGRKAGWATFRLPRMDVGRIIVCSPSGKQGAQDFVDGKVHFVFNGAELPLPTKEMAIFDKCVEIQKEFNGPVNDINGHCHLGVYIDSDNAVEISHIITQ